MPNKSTHGHAPRRARQRNLALAAALAAGAAFLAPPADAQEAAGVAAAAQEAGVIFSDERIRDMAARKIRLEEMAQRIEEISVLKQLETVDPVSARVFKAEITGTAIGADDAEFFEEYDKAQIDRGVVLPTLLGVQGAGGRLVAQVEYDGDTTFVREGYALDDYLRVETIEPNAIIVDLRGRKFRVTLKGG